MTGVLLVTPDTEFEAQVKRAFDGELESTRWWEAKLSRLHPQQAVQAIGAAEADVVVLGPGLPTPAALELAAGLDLGYSEICVVLVAKPTARLLEQALRCGVREIVPPGASDDVVQETLRRAGAAAGRRQRISGKLVEAAPARARVITVMSPKGGAGKTTVASNVAVRLGAAAPGRVVIIDLDLQFGDAGSALGLGAPSTIADAARAADRLDSTSLKVFLEPRPGGVFLLAGPHFPAEADEIKPAAVANMIEILAREFDYVVVDTASGLDEFVLAATEHSDDLVLVCATDVPSVRGLRKALDAFDLLGMTRQRRHLVLNRADARVGLSPKDVEATLGISFDAAIPSSRSVPISTNQGCPVVESEPRSLVARALATFGDSFVRGPGPEPAPHPPSAQPATSRWFPRRDGA